MNKRSKNDHSDKPTFSYLNIICVVSPVVGAISFVLFGHDLFWPLIGGILFLFISVPATVILLVGGWSRKVKEAGLSTLVGFTLAFWFLYEYFGADIYWLGKYDLLR